MVTSRRGLTVWPAPEMRPGTRVLIETDEEVTMGTITSIYTDGDGVLSAVQVKADGVAFGNEHFICGRTFGPTFRC